MTETRTDDEGFVDTVSRPETRGIELIGDAERHGRARDLFFVWAAPNVSILNLTVGATLILLGLEVWQAVAVIIASQTLWVFPGIIAASGPAAGTSGSVITRAMYGSIGNKLFVAFAGWLIGAAFLSLTWLASSFTGADLLRRFGIDDPVLVPIAVTITAYSSSMSLQAIGFRLHRIPATIIVGIVGTALTIYLVLSTSLLAAVNLMLQFLLIVSGPAMAIFVVDLLLRRNVYVGHDLFDDGPDGEFWYTGGWSIAGIAALVAGGFATAMCLATNVWAGPIASAMGDVDLSVPAGMLVAASVYVGIKKAGLGREARA
jgi:purine-cytosine permease-like protein